MKTCLICDDHALVRDAVSGLIRRQWPDTAILQASDFPTAWSLAGQRPDLCLADLGMPGADPVEGIEGILAAAPGVRLLVLTGLEDDEVMLDLLDRGVAGFASKTLNSETLGAAIALILAGGRYLPPRLAEIAARPRPPREARTPTAPRALLSDKQSQVLKLLAEGLSNKEIARTLALSPATIKTHVAHVIALIGAANRTDAAMKAQALGLL